MKKFFVFCLLICAVLLGSFAAADQSVVLSWSAPTERENGEPLTVADLGGYEIRYTLQGSADTSTVVIPDGAAASYVFDELPDGTHAFQIAAYDTNGLYSNFISIAHDQAVRPGSVGNVRSAPVINDVIAACLADPNCKVAVAGEW